MECEGGCNEGKDIEIGHCGTVEGSNPDLWWQFLNMKDDRETMIQMLNTTLCLEMVDDTNDENDNLVLSLMECDESHSLQWFHPENGDWEDSRFEIETSSGRCLSQEHHPKKNEDVYGSRCSTSRGYDTSYWVKY